MDKKHLPINLLIIEDNRYVRSGWEAVLTMNEGFQIIGSYANCEDAIKDDKFGDADVILMDIGLPGMNGIECVSFIKERHPEKIIVMCTVHEDDDKIFNAICAGAVGYLLKKTPPDELIASLKDAYNGGSPMTPSVARKVIASFHKTTIQKNKDDVELTERENQILSMMAEGKSYTAIAREIFLSLDGVYYHIRHIYEKLQVHSRAEAVAKGIQKKIIKPM
ncbi:MAG: response regulator transcription factor [bacterium]